MSHITVVYTNADTLTPNKLFELQARLPTIKPHIIAINEVKPKHFKERLKQDFALEGFTSYVCDLDPGIIMYVHEALNKSVSQVNFLPAFNEATTLEIKLRGGDKLLLGCVYRSPNSHDTNNDALNKLFYSICGNSYSDFNFPHTNWSILNTPDHENSNEALFLQTVQDCFLYQHVDQPTRARGTDAPSVIDLIFTNEEHMVSELQYLAPLGSSDHALLVFNYHCYTDFGSNKRVYLYSRGDYSAMREPLLESEWIQNFENDVSNLSTEDTWKIIKDKLLDLRAKYVPILSGVDEPKWKYEFPISDELKALIRSKDQANRKWMANNYRGDAEEFRLKYIRLRNKCKQVSRKEKRRYESKVAGQSKIQPKKFWKFANNKLKTKSGVAPLLSNSEDPSTICHNDKDKAEILQQQFVSVFTSEPIGPIPQAPGHTDIVAAAPYLDRAKVFKKLSSINTSKSCGPDEIHPRLVKELADLIAQPITVLYRKSLDYGELPLDWKEALVAPIYKKGSKKIASNYCPISLTSILCI
ncbi:uncharacterized protein LOC143030470 [Oratosquilla oratoria]|uniref:uncharacterized protein LOC143030470 n=1 Tax=Oratosquilla oratoria TaxID=337810 RepID=UPI003F771F5A